MSSRDDELAVVELDASSPQTVQAWRELARCSPPATAFARPEWLLAERAHLGGDTAPWLLGVVQRGELVGLAPLGVRIEGGRRCAVLCGSDLCDYRGILAAPHAREGVARAVLAYLSRRTDRWDACELAGIEARSPLLSATAPPGMRIERRERDVCPYVPIPEGASSLSDVVPSGFAKRVARCVRAARRAGRYEVLWARPDTIGAHLTTFFELHAARWKDRGAAGALASPAVRAFFRQLVPALAEDGAARVLELRLDGAPLASILSFAQHGRVLSYLGGFDPRFAKLSPGRLALAALFERAIQEGAREVDFLRGVEPYKYDWGARDRWTHTLHIRSVPP